MNKLKKEVLELLEQNDFENQIQKYDKRKLVNALFPLLCST